MAFHSNTRGSPCRSSPQPQQDSNHMGKFPEDSYFHPVCMVPKGPKKWRCPEMEVPSNHPFIDFPWFSLINHPAIGGTPIYGNPHILMDILKKTIQLLGYLQYPPCCPVQRPHCAFFGNASLFRAPESALDPHLASSTGQMADLSPVNLQEPIENDGKLVILLRWFSQRWWCSSSPVRFTCHKWRSKNGWIFPPGKRQKMTAGSPGSRHHHLGVWSTNGWTMENHHVSWGKSTINQRAFDWAIFNSYV